MVEKPEDLNLPHAVVSRIIRYALPDGIMVSKEAKSAIAKAASVFVLYTTSTSLLVSQKNKKKTLNAQDVLSALKDIEFDKFIEPLEASLEMYRKSQQNKKEKKEARAKAKKADEEQISSAKECTEEEEEDDMDCEVVEVVKRDQTGD